MNDALDRITELLNAPGAVSVQQGCELLCSLPDLAAAFFAGCRLSADGVPRHGPEVARRVHKGNRDHVTLWGLAHAGRIQPTDALDLTGVVPSDLALDLLTNVSSLRQLRIRWDNSSPLDALPRVEDLRLVTRARFGCPRTLRWDLLSATRGVRSLSLRCEGKRLLWEGYTPLDALASLALTFFRFPDDRVRIAHPSLSSLSLLRPDGRHTFTVEAPSLSSLSLVEASVPVVRIEAPSLRSLVVKRNLSLHTLDLRGCPELSSLQLQALTSLEQVTVPAGCVVQRTRADVAITRA